MKKPKKSEHDARQYLLNRLSRIEGQLSGVRRMVGDQESCMDVITQILAIRSALSMLGVELMKDEMLCQKGKKREIDEAFLKRLFTLQ